MENNLKTNTEKLIATSFIALEKIQEYLENSPLEISQDVKDLQVIMIRLPEVIDSIATLQKLQA